MKLAVIPARGGSKRIPRKNIRPFCGKPMIAWSIEAARKSDCFDHIIVSTDDEQIADIAREWGAEVPFMRPAELADDHTTTTPVIAHAIRSFEDKKPALTEVCCIYATAPFILATDLRRGQEAMKQSGSDFAVPVATYAYPIQRAVCIDSQGRLEMIQPRHFNTRSQDLAEAWHDAGQFYWGRRAAWLAAVPILSNSAVAVRLPRHRVQDIDTYEDWVRAERIFLALQSKADNA